MLSTREISRIPVNKGVKSRLGWTRYSDLYENVSTRASTSFLYAGKLERNAGKVILFVLF